MSVRAQGYARSARTVCFVTNLVTFPSIVPILRMRCGCCQRDQKVGGPARINDLERHVNIDEPQYSAVAYDRRAKVDLISPEVELRVLRVDERY